MASLQPASVSPEWLRELGWAEVYEVRGLIGRGGMGRVYEGWHRTLGVRVALKILDPRLSGDDQARARFEKEARTLAQLQEPTPHPNIVRVLDFKLTDEVGCLVMAHVDGVDVKTWCEEHSLGIREKAALLAKAARAAGYFHALGVVHRDLKPANILVRERDAEPVIVDFGIVRRYEDVTLTQTRQSPGTAAYMAPEQIQTRAKPETPGPRADVYALGIILYELLSGELPHGATLSEVLARHDRETPPPFLRSRVKGLPRDLEKICFKAIAHAPAERYADGTALAEDLRRFLDGEPVEARPHPRLAHALRRLRRRPGLAAALAVAGLAGVWLLWQNSEQGAAMATARLREEIGLSLSAKDWSAEHLQSAQARIEALARREPAQAASFQRALVEGAVRDIAATLGQARLAEGLIPRLEASLAWIAAHDAAAHERLRTLLQGRLRRWEPLWELKAPFDNVTAFFDAAHAVARHEESPPHVAAIASQRLSLRPQAKPPLELEAVFLTAKGDAQNLGLSVEQGSNRYLLQYCQPPDARHLEYLEQAQNGEPAPAATLAISQGETLLGVLPVARPVRPDTEALLEARIEGRRLTVRWNDGPDLTCLLDFASTAKAGFALEQTPLPRITRVTGWGPLLPAQASPLERGDNLAANGQWQAAEAEYLKLLGDPEHGAEAAFKAGECQMRSHQTEAALATWQNASLGLDSPWRTRACFELWKHHALAGRLELARPFLDQLPARENLPPGCVDQLSSSTIRSLSDRYRSTARGLAVLAPMPEIEDAIRAHQLLGMSHLDLALRFAFARHYNGTDAAATDLFRAALLKPPRDPDSLTAKQNNSLQVCFDLWMRMSRGEQDTHLAEIMDRWRSLPAGHPITWTLQGEQARMSARRGNAEEAKRLARQVQSAPGVASLTLLSAALLRHHLGDVTEEEPLQRALRQLSQRPREGSATFLMDLVVLHSLARDWTPQLTAEIFGALFSINQSDSKRDSAQSQLNRFFLEDDSFTRGLNAMLDGESGRELAHACALRLRPARVLTRELLQCVLASHLAFCLFDAPATGKAEEIQAVQKAIQLLMAQFTQGRIEVGELLLLIQGWKNRLKDPRLQTVLARWPEDLRLALSRLVEMSATRAGEQE